jgi:hypothetical protein
MTQDRYYHALGEFRLYLAEELELKLLVSLTWNASPSRYMTFNRST